MFIERRKVTSEFARKSFWVGVGILVVCFLSIFSIYWGFQILQFDYFNNRALQNITKTIDLVAPRGIITDCQNQILAENQINFTLFLIRENIRNLEKTIITASFLADVSREQIVQTLQKYERDPLNYFIPIRANLPIDRVAYIESREDEFPEFQVEIQPLRSYPYANLSSHVLGYVSEINRKELENYADHPTYRTGDLIGKSGLERQYEAYLKGVKGSQTFIKNNLEKIQSVVSIKKPIIGNTVVLTLDAELQKEVEFLFSEYYGVVGVADLKTGGILVLLSKPDFRPEMFIETIDPNIWNALVTAPEKPLINKFLQGIYSPGSVFKIVMALAGLQEGIITPETTVFCQGSTTIYNHVFNCWESSGHGTVNLFRALERSCNIYFYNLGKKLDIDTIAEYARLFGLGEKSNLDLPNELSGIIPTKAWKEKTFQQKWFAGETISVAIGGGSLSVTPVQLLQMISIVALRGKKIQLHLLDRIEENGKTTYRFPIQGHTIPVKKENFDLVIEGLHRVVNGEGTARSAQVEGMDICGKTGTSQIISKENPFYKKLVQEKRFKPNSWFVSFAPRNNPRYAMVVLIENGGDAGRIAAPLAGKIYQKLQIYEKQN